MRIRVLHASLQHEILPASAVVGVLAAAMGMLGGWFDPTGAVILVASSALLAIAGVFSEEEPYQRPC